MGNEEKTMKNRTKYMLKQDLSYIKNYMRYQIAAKTTVLDNQMILFESYSGDKYADSVRAIYEELLQDERFHSFYFVWAFKNPEDHKKLLSNRHTILVRKGSSAYRKYYARSRYWINNVTVADYLNPKKDQIYIETWHGTPLKKLGCDIEFDSDARQTRHHMHNRYIKKGKKFTFLPAPSDYYADCLRSAFQVKSDNAFIFSGYPRNDRLFHYTEDDVASIKTALGISSDKRVILYTPTWRDSDTDKDGKFTLQAQIDLDSLMEGLGDDYVLLYRLHHQIKDDQSGMSASSQIIDVSNYEDIRDLYLISDLMITDYSSTMFDYSILKRPMIFHMYDKERYESKIRGFYISTDELPGPITSSTDELIASIRELSQNFQPDETYLAFCEKFNQYETGDASKKILDRCLSFAPHRYSKYERFLKYCKKTANRVHLVGLICRYNVLGFFRSHGLFHNNNSLRLERLKNTHSGERCFLIGNGPSLTGADLDLLKDEYTFGTNMVYKIFDQTSWRPSFHCVSDTIYASKLGTELSQKVKAPLFTTERTYQRMKNKPINTTYVHTLQSERYKVRGNIQAYCMVKATVLSLAAEMAFHMGFKEIYLLGVDCTNPHTKGGHFTDNYTTKEVAETDINRIKTRMKKTDLTTEQIGEHIIDRSLEVYHLLDEYAKKHGIQIYNATRGGNLEIFPRVKLEDVLEDRKKETR